jgi:hypothetical protein
MLIGLYVGYGFVFGVLVGVLLAAGGIRSEIRWDESQKARQVI